MNPLLVVARVRLSVAFERDTGFVTLEKDQGAGRERYEVHKSKGLWDYPYVDKTVPAGQLTHAIKDAKRRRPPDQQILLDRPGEHRLAWCGTKLRVVLPWAFRPSAVDACPDCLDALLEAQAEMTRNP